MDADGEARCCNPADCSHRAMTASPVSLGRPALCRDPSYRAVAAAALLCCIWPPMGRCERLWGANFQDLLSTLGTQTTRDEQNFKIHPPKSIQPTYILQTSNDRNSKRALLYPRSSDRSSERQDGRTKTTTPPTYNEVRIQTRRKTRKATDRRRTRLDSQRICKFKPQSIG